MDTVFTAWDSFTGRSEQAATDISGQKKSAAPFNT